MNQNVNIKPLTVKREGACAFFSRIGLAVIALQLVTFIVQYAVSYGIIFGASYDAYATLMNNTWWFIWLLSLLPLYGVALPIFYLLLPKPVGNLPPVERKKMGVGSLIAAFIMCIFAMYAGNLIGSNLSVALAELLGRDALNPVSSLVGEGIVPFVATVLFGVILGPMGEELIFRRLLTDRLAPFGEGVAVLFSGLAFGLFHGNLFQFFYAFFIGCLLAFIRVRTGRDLYNILLHSALNFFGMVVSPAVLSAERLTLLEQIASDPTLMTEDALMELAPLLIFVLAAIGVFFAGIVLFIVALARGKFRLKRPAIAVECGTRRAFWLNPYVITALAIMLALIVYSVFS